MVKRPGPQRPRIVPKSQAKLFIGEYMAIRGMKPADLAAELDTTEATVSRWINERRAVNQHKQRAIEEVFGLPPGGLARPPSDAPAHALLAGLSPEKKQQALSYIEFLRNQDNH